MRVTRHATVQRSLQAGGPGCNDIVHPNFAKVASCSCHLVPEPSIFFTESATSRPHIGIKDKKIRRGNSFGPCIWSCVRIEECSVCPRVTPRPRHAAAYQRLPPEPSVPRLTHYSENVPSVPALYMIRKGIGPEKERRTDFSEGGFSEKRASLQVNHFCGFVGSA